ncbi:MAG: acyl-CoA dehydrogenase family protein, partial [Gemmatimonadaceae bacterium]
MLDLFPLTEEQREIEKVARDFAAAEIVPYASQWDRDSYFEPTLVKKLGDLGFLGMLTAEEYDGLGVDSVTYLVALEEIAAADASVAVMMSVHNSLPTQMLSGFGSEEQKQRFLKPMARGELLGAFALSEAEAGSDAAALTTQAVRDGDSWVLNGTKSWVTSGPYAGVIMVQARTDSSDDRRGARGIGAFIVTPDMGGFSVGKKEDKMGLRASPTVQLVFEDVRVPASNLLGDPSMGYVYAMRSLNAGRLGIGAQALGIARAASDAAVAYAGERKQFGEPIKNFQGIQFKLSNMATRISAARALLHAAGRAKDANASSAKQAASMAKLFASETAMWVTTEAIQVF